MSHYKKIEKKLRELRKLLEYPLRRVNAEYLLKISADNSAYLIRDRDMTWKILIYPRLVTEAELRANKTIE